MRKAIPTWWMSSVQRRFALLGLGVGLYALTLWVSASPETPAKLQAQPLTASLAPTLGAARMQTETLVSASDALREQSASHDLLLKILEGSRLNPLWLKDHGFSTGSEALERLHGLMNGHTRLSAPNAAKIAFGPQGGSTTSTTSEMPALATQERYVQAAVPFSNGGQGDTVLVRWRNASDNAVLDLSVQAIQRNENETIPIWMYSANDWPPGRYRVEVISPDPGLKLLAAGDFEIVGPNAPLTPFSFEVSSTLP
jgi:hypothetical protein